MFSGFISKIETLDNKSTTYEYQEIQMLFFEAINIAIMKRSNDNHIDLSFLKENFKEDKDVHDRWQRRRGL